MRLVSLPLSLPLSLPFISPQCNPFIIRCAASSATVKSPCERIAPGPTAFTLVFGLGFYTRIFKIQGVPTDISVAFFSPQSLFHVWVKFLSISIKPGLKEGADGSFVHPVVLCQSYCSLTYFLSPFLVFSIHARSCSAHPCFAAFSLPAVLSPPRSLSVLKQALHFSVFLLSLVVLLLLSCHYHGNPKAQARPPWC